MLMKGLNGNQLKLIAVIVMLIDHIGYMIGRVVYPTLIYGTARFEHWNFLYYLFRSIGRTAFPVFCFMIAEGFVHTRDWKKYALRLGVFGLISEIPFNLMVSGKWTYQESQNVFFTLLIGLLVLALMRETARRIPGREGMIAQLPVLALGCLLANLLKTDYSWSGVLLIAVFYWFGSSRISQCILGYLCMAGTTGELRFQIALLVPFILLYFYNGERGREIKGLKWLFYWFYPVHMALAAVICPVILR